MRMHIGQRALTYLGLILRSGPQDRVSKDGPPASFETPAARAPQDEGGDGLAPGMTNGWMIAKANTGSMQQ
jgi:hypothetical protein